MIKQKQHIIYRVSAFLVMLVFLLPAVISAMHTTQGHDHSDQCAFAGETHIHESTLDCDFGDLHVVKVEFYAFAKAYITTVPEISRLLDTHPIAGYTTETIGTKSRGPPSC